MIASGNPKNSPQRSGWRWLVCTSTATSIEPDTGFNENLPFRKATTATTKADPDGSAFPAIVHASSTDNRKALLVSLAFAAIIFTLAFHIRFLMRRIDQVV